MWMRTERLVLGLERALVQGKQLSAEPTVYDVVALRINRLCGTMCNDNVENMLVDAGWQW